MNDKSIRILAIESSCDETSAAIIEGVDFPEIKTNIIASQIDIHKITNGVVPEVAARAHAEQIVPVIEQALGGKIQEKISHIDAIAVTYGPGLVGSLLVGVEAAKALAYANSKPLVPVNHLEGHLYAALMQGDIVFPALALIVSGGHTEFVLINGHGDYEIVGQTLDDAAGEAFDKVATLLGLPYPGGPAISRLAQSGNPGAYPLPRPMIHEPNLNVSFSGLKTAVVNFTVKNPDFNKEDLAASFEQAVVDTLVGKFKKAALEYNPRSFLLSGGVAANSRLRQQLEKEFGQQLRVSPIELCGDNAGMIGLAAWYRYKAGKTVSWQNVNVAPNVRLNTP